MASFVSHLIAFFLCLAVAAVSGTVTLCGSTGRSCLQGQSYCDGTTCVCQAPRIYGDPFFRCRRKNAATGEVKNDPLLKNTEDENTRFPFPCRYVLNHIVTSMLNRHYDVIGTCETKVSLFHGKSIGKYYVHGMDFAVKLNYDNGTVVSRSIRKYGILDNGVRDVTINATHAFVPDGGFYNDDPNFYDPSTGVSIKCFNEPANTQEWITAKFCGVVASFVPFDITLRRDQPFVAGVALDINCAHLIEWLSPLDVMSLRLGQFWSDIQLGGLSNKDSVFARAFRSDVDQVQPVQCDECDRAKDIQIACSDSDLEDAAVACNWMFDQARFVKCIDTTDEGQDILQLYNDCVESFCTGAPNCNGVKSAISSAGCASLTGINNLNAFMSGLYC